MHEICTFFAPPTTLAPLRSLVPFASSFVPLVRLHALAHTPTLYEMNRRVARTLNTWIYIAGRGREEEGGGYIAGRHVDHGPPLM